jgi:hypothetical protein
VVDPEHLRFAPQYLRSINDVVSVEAGKLESWLSVFREQPFHDGPDVAASLDRLLDEMEGTE